MLKQLVTMSKAGKEVDRALQVQQEEDDADVAQSKIINRING